MRIALLIISMAVVTALKSQDRPISKAEERLLLYPFAMKGKDLQQYQVALSPGSSSRLDQYPIQSIGDTIYARLMMRGDHEIADTLKVWTGKMRRSYTFVVKHSPNDTALPMIFPNPGSGEMTLKGSYKSVPLTIYDQSGNSVYMGTVSGDDPRIDITQQKGNQCFLIRINGRTLKYMKVDE